MGNSTFDFEAYFEKKYAGKTWAKVMEENEFFDGEVAIEAAAKARWREVNKAVRERRAEVSRRRAVGG